MSELRWKTLTTTASICDLISSLKPAFDVSDLSGAERTLFSWAESLKSELSNTMSDDFLLVAVEKAELEYRISQLEKELDLGKKENITLQEQNRVLEIREVSLENEMGLVKNENVDLKEKVKALSKIVEGSKRQKDLQEKHGSVEDYFVNKTPTKRAFRAPFSDSESSSDDNLPIGTVIKNINRGKKRNSVVKTARPRKRRLVRVPEIEDCGVPASPVARNCIVGDEPGPDTGINEKCQMDDFSDTEDYGGCEMNRSDCSGSPVARKMSSRKRNIKLDFSDTEEEIYEIDESNSDDKVHESKYKGTKPTGKFVPGKKYIILDKSESEEETDTKSDSKGDSLGGFIVRGSEPNTDNSEEPYRELESDSEDDVTLGDVLKKIRREKKYSGKKWEYEAEMLTDFGNRPELCLIAVCALYRQQTEDEQEDKSTFYDNRRGFSQLDAPRGSEIAEFLTDNDPWGPVKKTVNDLQKHDSFAIDVCEKLAKRYSKQLFKIYHRNEDPFFNQSMFG